MAILYRDMGSDRLCTITREAVTGRVIDTRYVGIWAYLSNPTHGRTQTAESIADAIGATPEFVRAAFDHFHEVGCLLADEGEQMYTSDKGLEMRALGLDVDQARHAMRNERDRLNAEQEGTA